MHEAQLTLKPLLIGDSLSMLLPRPLLSPSLLVSLADGLLLDAALLESLPVSQGGFLVVTWKLISELSRSTPWRERSSLRGIFGLDLPVGVRDFGV